MPNFSMFLNLLFEEEVENDMSKINVFSITLVEEQSQYNQINYCHDEDNMDDIF